eukprot:3541201-Amphidinium_carterae.1
MACLKQLAAGLSRVPQGRISDSPRRQGRKSTRAYSARRVLNDAHEPTDMTSPREPLAIHTTMCRSLKHDCEEKSWRTILSSKRC